MSGWWVPGPGAPVRSADRAGTESILTSGRRTQLVVGAAPAGFVDEAAGPPTGHRVWSATATVLADVDVGEPATRWDRGEELAAALDAGDELAWVVCGRAYRAWFKGLVAACRPRRIVPLLVVDHRVLVGPELRLGGPQVAMLLDRLLTNVPGLRARVARDHLRVAPGPVWPRVLAAARLLWEVPRPHRRSHEALILDLQRGQCRDQGLLALADEAVNGPQALVGDLLGVIRAVGPAEPAELADIVAVDTAVGGADGRTALGSAATVVTRPATTRALCEAAERLAAGAAVDTAVVGCAAELGAAATSWLPYTDEQYETPGFAYAPLADEHVTHWSRGRDVATGRALWVPTRLASLDPRCVGPRFAPTTSTGLAAGADVWSAISRGLLEVVERDVVTRCWTTAALDELAAEAWAGAAVQSLRGRSCTVRVWRCRDPAPVVIAWLAQPDGGGALGCAAAMTLGDAARHALEEAALMLVHRRRADALLAPACCPVGAPSVDVTPADVWADLPGLVRRYEPWWVELTDRNAAAVGLHVVAVGSRRAVDFPGPGRPPALRRCALLADNLRDDFPFAPPEMP